MASRSNPAVLAGSALIGIVLVVIGVVLAAGHHPKKGPILIAAGVIVVLAGFFVDRRVKAGR